MWRSDQSRQRSSSAGELKPEEPKNADRRNAAHRAGALVRGGVPFHLLIVDLASAIGDMVLVDRTSIVASIRVN